MVYTSAFERDLQNWFTMSSSSSAPCFTLPMSIFSGFRRFSSFSDTNNDRKMNQRPFSEWSAPLLSNATFGIGSRCLVRLWHRVLHCNVDFGRFFEGFLLILMPIMMLDRIKGYFLNALHLCFR